MKKYLIGTIIFSLIFSSFLFSFQKTEAVGLEVPVSDKVQRQKESGVSIFGVPIPGTSWDSLAWMAANIVIRRLVDETVNWINSGFEGSPFFVTNPGDFLMDAADQASGLFLAKLRLTGLCYDWTPRIELALRLQRPFQQRMQCTLSRVISNYEAFINDFINGGWAGWIAMTSQPQNNIYGAYLEASGELTRTIMNAQNQAQTKANWGKGFLSQEVCSQGALDQAAYNSCMHPTGAGPAGTDAICKKAACSHFEIQTPGTTIENRLTQALGSDVQRLISADEFNEILSALFGQLIQKGISAIGKAVAGGGGGSTFSNNPEALTEEKAYFDGLKTSALETINSSIAGETQYRNTKQDSSNIIDDIKTSLNRLASCQDISARIAGYENKKLGIDNDILRANGLITDAGTYKTRINNATTYEQISAILDDFNNIMQPRMHSIEEIGSAATEYSTLQDELGQINQEECPTGTTTP